jgi:PadR family transcriptional regulator, regulatory protein PadR
MARKKDELLTSDLLRGNSTTLVLSILSENPAPGFVIAEMIRSRSENLIPFKEGSIYPLLHDLQNKGFVTSLWEIPDGERPKRVYELTLAGRKELEVRLRAWSDFARAMSLVTGVNPHEQHS